MKIDCAESVASIGQMSNDLREQGYVLEPVKVPGGWALRKVQAMTPKERALRAMRLGRKLNKIPGARRKPGQ